MATPSYFYKEARLNLEPPSPGSSVVNIELPTIVDQGQSQRQDSWSATAKNNAARATTSSIYYRKHNNYPKGFLWRVLEHDTVLSIRTSDICKPKKTADANLILNFHFPHPIVPTCVALSDPSDHDALSISVLDTKNQLYNLFLRPDSFRKRSFAETGLGDACKVHQPRALNSKEPYRLVAVDHNKLVATLKDGGLVGFDMSNGLKEKFYNVKRWFSSLINHGGMDTKAAAAAVETGLGLTDASFLFTVCLDHHIRVWNLDNGTIIRSMDLLDAPRNPQETGKWQLDPSQSNLIRIVGGTEGHRLCVTYSPVGTGEFKFWSLRADDANSVEIKDIFGDDGVQFVPTPPLGSDIWTLADFNVAERVGSHGFVMWLLWKNNIAYRVQELSFIQEDLPETWQNGWRSVFSDTAIPTPKVSGSTDSTDPSESWLKHIFYPGRFSKVTIEAAFSAYENAIGKRNESPPRNSRDLAESISDAIATTASLSLNSSGHMDHDSFRTSSEVQWRKFYRILIELDKPRGEALALAYEAESGMPWVVCADTISAIRECSELEQICHNPTSPFAGSKAIPTIIDTGLNFVDAFSDNLLQTCQSAFRPEMFEEANKPDEERMSSISDKAGFWRQISDEDCAQVNEALGRNFGLVTTKLYDRVCGTLNETWDPQHPTELPLSEFGRQMIVKTAQDIIELYWHVTFSQLVLLVHMEFEYDRPEEALRNTVETGVVYSNLLIILQRLELLRWLAHTQILTPISRAEKSNATPGGSPAAQKRQGEEFKYVTALENNVGHLLGLPELGSIPAGGMPSIITNIVADLCAPQSSVELQPQYFQCSLLARDRPDLAIELAPFCKADPFSTYVQGRVYLALKDFESASMWFKKAASGMSTPQANIERHSSGLLDDTEWNLLYAGQSRYYCHLMALFEQQKAYSYVREFARLAILFIKSSEDDAVVRLEVQARLFACAMATSDFNFAHMIIVKMTEQDHALQQSCLRQLVKDMCDNLHAEELEGLTFPGLQGQVDNILEQLCHNTADLMTTVPYHQILFSWRIKHNDYRGAASILFDRIHKLRQRNEGDQVTGDDILDTEVTKQYLMLINVLSCVDEKQAWITIDGPAHPSNLGSGAPEHSQRRVVTLADIRKEYQDELDRITAIHNNQFGFAADDEMEIL